MPQKGPDINKCTSISEYGIKYGFYTNKQNDKEYQKYYDNIILFRNIYISIIL